MGPGHNDIDSDGAGLAPVAEGQEGTSLLGRALMRAIPENREQLEALLESARRAYAAQPGSIDAAVWVGRRLAYLGRYRDAIEWFTQAITVHGQDAKLLRHRGHRYVTVRRFDRAREDFETASRLISGLPDEVEPDGVPNALDTPISSLHSNIWYHLALVCFLQGDDERALQASSSGLKVATNSDRLVSQTYWQYLILRRMGRDSEAMALLDPIHPGLDLVENFVYLRLLLVYKGQAAAADVLAEANGEIEVPTLSYGLGMQALLDGERAMAIQLFERATSGPAWPAFGYLAAEAELARLGRAEGFGHSS